MIAIPREEVLEAIVTRVQSVEERLAELETELQEQNAELLMLLRQYFKLSESMRAEARRMERQASISCPPSPRHEEAPWTDAMVRTGTPVLPENPPVQTCGNLRRT